MFDLCIFYSMVSIFSGVFKLFHELSSIENGFSVAVRLSGYLKEIGFLCLDSEIQFSRENLGKNFSGKI